MKFIGALFVFLQVTAAYGACELTASPNYIPDQTDWNGVHKVYSYEPEESVTLGFGGSDCPVNPEETHWFLNAWPTHGGSGAYELKSGVNTYTFTSGNTDFYKGIAAFVNAWDGSGPQVLEAGAVIQIGYRPLKPVLTVNSCEVDPESNLITAHISVGPEDDHPGPMSKLFMDFSLDGEYIGSEPSDSNGTLNLTLYPGYGNKKIKVTTNRTYYKEEVGAPDNTGFPLYSEESNEAQLNCPEEKPRKCGPGDLVDEDGQTCGPEDPEDGNNTDNCPSCEAKGEPVNIANGFLWHQNTDFSLPGRTSQTGLTLQRTYTAVNGSPMGDFGPNWRHNWETRLEIAADVIWVDENGGPWTFRYVPGSNRLASPLGNPARLYRFSNRYELIKQDKTKLTFSLEGNLTAYTDRFGESVALSYDSGGKLQSISAPLAGTVSFTRNAQGRIATAIRDRDNLTYTYAYDGQGRLWKVTDFANRTYEYSYNSGQEDTYAHGMLSSIRDPLNRLTQFTYYDSGRAFQQMEPGGVTRTFRYEFSPSSKRKGRKSGTRRRTDFIAATRVDDVDGSATTYFFDDRFHTIKTVHQEDGEASLKYWNAEGFLGSVTDESGATTTMGYDDRGNMTSLKIPGKVNPTLITYEETFNVPATINSPGRGEITNTISSTDGTITATAHTDGTNTLSLAFTRDAFGNLLSTNNGRATYADVRDSNGLLSAVYDAHNAETRAYDSRYRLHTRTFQGGRVLTYAYDDDDRVTGIDDSAGPDTSMTYDVVGRLLSRSVSDGSSTQTTTYAWDVYDRLTSETDALGRATRYFYSSRRVLPSPSQIKDPAGRITKFSYDRRGRLVTKTDPRGAETRYSYNARGNLLTVTDALGQVTSYEYSPSGKKTKEIRPSAAGRSSSAHVITYEYDEADRLVKEAHVSQTGGNDRSIIFAYDVFDRLISKTLVNGATVEDVATYSYESQLDHTTMASANNAVASLSFTNEPAPPFAIMGYSVAATESGNPKGLIEDTFSITRDTTGNIASVTGVASGAVFTKAYDSAGRLTSFNAKDGALKGAIAYDGYGRKERVSFSDGTSGDFAYDLLGRVIAINWKEGYKDSVRQHLNYDLAGNIIGIARENARYELGYDANDQLISSKHKGLQGVPSYNKAWELDALGSRIGGSDGPGTFVSNFLTQNGTSSFNADADGCGQTVQEITGDKAKNYTYRADGRVFSFSSGSLSVSYFYDGLDRLIAKLINDGSSYVQSFVHLADEHRVLLGKAGDGSVTTYIDGQGQLERLGEVKSGVGKGYITDHLGSVLNSAPAGSSKVYGLYGEPTAKPALTASAPALEFGHAGYSYNRESGEYGTESRRYNPILGRWTSQDSIGLRSGDSNLYGYVFNNPLKYTDPSGNGPLTGGACVTIGLILGGATGILNALEGINREVMVNEQITRLQNELNACQDSEQAKVLTSQINALKRQLSTDRRVQAGYAAFELGLTATFLKVCLAAAVAPIP